MKKSLILYLIVITINFSMAQNHPISFEIGYSNKLQKVSADNPASNSISDIITLGDTVWLGSSRGVSLSTNRGDTWTNFYDMTPFGKEGVSIVAFDKYTNTVWVGTVHTFEKDGQTIFEGSGLHYTQDGGITWNSVTQPVDNPGDSLLSYGINNGVDLPMVRALPVTVTPQNVVWQMDFTPNTIWIATYAGGIRKSTNFGQTWQRVLLPSDFVNSVTPTDTIRFSLRPKAGAIGNLNHIGFSVVAPNETTIFAGTAGGINKSTDNGISWQKLNHQNQLSPISGNWIFSLAYNYSNNSIWASTRQTEDENEFNAVSSSSDGGDTWQIFLQGERVLNFGFKNTDVIAASENGAFRTNNSGVTWILPNRIYDENSTLSITTNYFISAASQGNDVWLGSADGLAKITEIPGTVWEGKWKVYFASIPLESKEDAYVFPNPFSPKNDEGLKFKYTTEGVTSNVTIRIYDFAMNYVRTVIQNTPRNISSDIERVTWDGKNDAGEIVSNGVYFYRIEIADRDPLYGKIIVMN